MSKKLDDIYMRAYEAAECGDEPFDFYESGSEEDQAQSQGLEDGQEGYPPHPPSEWLVL